MTDLEITRLCAEAMFTPLEWEQRLFEYDPLHDDAQCMALVKKLSIQIHHHGTAAYKANLVTVEGVWVPYGPRFKVCAPNLNRAICECVAKMQQAKIAIKEIAP